MTETIDVGTLSERGQIVIPIKIRRALRLRPGGRVFFVKVSDGSYRIEPESLALQRQFEAAEAAATALFAAWKKHSPSSKRRKKVDAMKEIRRENR